MAKGLSPPHLLLAAANPIKMIQNLHYILTVDEIKKLDLELNRNVSALFNLGVVHFSFSKNLQNTDWRQKISRLYYAVYNVRRAISLKFNGSFSTDSSDHKNVDQIPDSIKNKSTHTSNLRTLREDRNLADYSHLASIQDLVLSPDDALAFAEQFIKDCKKYLEEEGVEL